MKVEFANVVSNYERVETTNPETQKVETRVQTGREPVVKNEPEKTNQEVDRKKVEEAVEKLNKQFEKISGSQIKFKIHETEGELNRVSIKVVDRESKELIAEIPSEESIEISEKLREIAGVLFDAKN